MQVSPLRSVDALHVEYVAAVAGSENLPLVFLHGWGTDSRCWSLLLEQFRVNHDCYLIDLPGFGNNIDAEIGSVSELTVAISDVLPEACVLVGWSLGGMLAMQAASISSAVKALVTIGTNAKFTVSPDWPNAMPPETFREFVEGFEKAPEKVVTAFYGLQAMGDIARKKVITSLRVTKPDNLASVAGKWQQALGCLAEMDNRERLRSLSCPSLFIFGQNDTLVPSGVVSDFRRLNPLQQTYEVKDAGHAPHLSSPDQVVANIRCFIFEAAGISKKNIARSFSDAAKSYDDNARLQRKVVCRLAEKARQLSLPDGPIVDMGCGTGAGLKLLRTTFSRECIGFDIAEGMTNAAKERLRGQNIAIMQGDVESLPFADSSISLAFSSLAVQWCSHLSHFCGEVFRVLQPGGWLCFSTLGPRTLYELRTSWRQVDNDKHVNDFVPPSRMAAELSESGLNVITFCEDMMVLHYESVIHLMRELKGIGAHNINKRRAAGLTGRFKLERLFDVYNASYGVENTVPATYQVHYYLVKKPNE